MKVRLTKKFAERLDDIDLSESKVGDCLDLPEPAAHLLLAEEWAVPERRMRRSLTRVRRRADDGIQGENSHSG